MASSHRSNRLHLSQRIISTFGLAAFILPGCSNDSSSGNDTAARVVRASAATIGAAKTPLDLPPGAIRAENMIAYAQGVLMSPKDDQFAKPFDDKPLIGRPFKVTVHYDKYESSLHYTYNSEHEKLTIWADLSSSFHRGKERDPKLDYLILQRDSVHGTAKPMSNAFGVTKAVTPVTHTTFGLGSRRESHVGLFPKETYSDEDYVFYAA